MSARRMAVARLALPALIVNFSAFAADPVARFVDVGDGVKLEVLDWGGAGRPVILLAGSGNTGHVFEEFAPKLAGCQVYAITGEGTERQASRSAATLCRSSPRTLSA